MSKAKFEREAAQQVIKPQGNTTLTEEVLGALATLGFQNTWAQLDAIDKVSEERIRDIRYTSLSSIK